MLNDTANYWRWLDHRRDLGIMHVPRDPLPREPTDRECATGDDTDPSDVRGRCNGEAGSAFAGAFDYDAGEGER